MQPGWIAGYLSKQIVQFMHVYAIQYNDSLDKSQDIAKKQVLRNIKR